MNIDEYVSAVDAALTQAAARPGLDDLREFLTERAAEIGEADACAELGSPADYAAELEAAFASDPTNPDHPNSGKFAGVPYNFHVDDQWWKRIFNPADERILVPKVFGWGWSINLGAVAVRLGLIAPDDVADDTISQLSPVYARRALWASAVVATIGLAGAIIGHQSGNFPTHWGFDGTPDQWGSWTTAVTIPTAVGAGVTILSALPTLLRHSILRRLSAQAAGTFILIDIDGIALLTAFSQSGHPLGWLIVPILLLGCVAAAAPLLLSFRAAVRRAAAES